MVNVDAQSSLTRVGETVVYIQTNGFFFLPKKGGGGGGAFISSPAVSSKSGDELSTIPKCLIRR